MNTLLLPVAALDVATELAEAVNCADRGDPITLKVAVIYDDAVAARRAMGLLAMLTKNMSPDVEYYPVLCRFDALENEGARGSSFPEADQADMILVSLHGTESLPVFLVAWIADCRMRKQGEGVAVIVVSGGEPIGGISLEADTGGFIGRSFFPPDISSKAANPSHS